MPFKSKAQRGFMNANKDKMESEGVNVDEWNSSSKGLALPERAESQPIPAKKPRLDFKKKRHDKAPGHHLRTAGGNRGMSK